MGIHCWKERGFVHDKVRLYRTSATTLQSASFICKDVIPSTAHYAFVCKEPQTIPIQHRYNAQKVLRNIENLRVFNAFHEDASFIGRALDIPSYLVSAWRLTPSLVDVCPPGCLFLIPPQRNANLRFKAVTSWRMQVRVCVWDGFKFTLWPSVCMFPPGNATMPFGNTHNLLKMNYSAEQEYPDLSQHNNHMAKVITPEMYADLRDKQTPSGFTLDDVIQTGIDNPGKCPCSHLPRPFTLMYLADTSI